MDRPVSAGHGAPGSDENAAPDSETRVVGVGPWQGEWPAGEQWDPELLRDGDRRNVADQYRYWRMDAIIADLDSRRHAFHVAVENWEHDFNIGSVVRTANAFLAREVHIIGRRRWNRRGAMVTDRYQHVRHHASVAEFMDWARGEGLAVLAIDNVPGSQLIETFDLPERCVLVFGQEGPGISKDLVAQADAVLAIEQFGSTRSINAGAAAAVTMHAWIRRHVFGQRVS